MLRTEKVLPSFLSPSMRLSCCCDLCPSKSSFRCVSAKLCEFADPAAEQLGKFKHPQEIPKVP